MSKSMSNRSDKEIDRLSREAAEFYEPDESRLSWNKLEQKLLEQMPERPPDGIRFGRFSPFIWGSAVVMLAGISFFSIKKLAYHSSSTPTVQTVKRQENRIQEDSLASTRLSSAPAYPILNLAADSQRASKKTVAEEITNEAGYARKSANYISHLQENKDYLPTGSAVQIKKSTSTPGAQSTLAPKGSASISNQSFYPSFDQSSTNASATTKIIAGDNARQQRIDLLPIVFTHKYSGKVQGNDSAMNRLATAMANHSAPQKTLHINRSLNIGFSFGPDYTNAGGISNNELGNNIGMTIGYYLNSRLSVNTGLFYSNKFYWATAPKHAPDPNQSMIATAASPITHIENINGACSMYEIPMTVRYDFAKVQKTKVFVNAGITSYLIRNQSYIYFFHDFAITAAWKTNDNSRLNYWAGVGNLSAGLEQELGKGLSFQLEPYLKIPFRGMGLANVKLTSYGMLFSIRYAPVLSKKKK